MKFLINSTYISLLQQEVLSVIFIRHPLDGHAGLLARLTGAARWSVASAPVYLDFKVT